jgi:hypothetical protein
MKETNKVIIAVTGLITIFAFMTVWKSCTPAKSTPVQKALKAVGSTKPAQGSTVTITEKKPSGEQITTVITPTVRNHKVNLGVVLPDAFREGKLSRKVYEFGYEYRLFDHVWVGSKIDTDQRVGLTIGVEF